MPELPDRPHLDQVRYQARELQRAAAAGDNAARRQIHSVAARRVTLASAQLAVARQYGFASWPQLTAEVARRRAAIDDPGPAPAAAPLPPLLAAWYELDSAGRDLVAAQYADRPDCGPSSTRCSRTRRGPARPRSRPGPRWSPDLAAAHVRRGQADDQARVDLGLRLENATPGGRMLAARNVGSGTINVRIALGCAADVDGEVAGWLRQAYEENTAPPGRGGPPGARRGSWERSPSWWRAPSCRG